MSSIDTTGVSEALGAWDSIDVDAAINVVDAGIDVHYETAVTAIDTAAHTVTVAGEGAVRYDSLVIATGWNYADPGVPGGDLQGLYYVKNILKIDQDFYPERLHKLVVINSPWYFPRSLQPLLLPDGRQDPRQVCHPGN